MLVCVVETRAFGQSKSKQYNRNGVCLCLHISFNNHTLTLNYVDCGVRINDAKDKSNESQDMHCKYANDMCLVRAVD